MGVRFVAAFGRALLAFGIAVVSVLGFTIYAATGVATYLARSLVVVPAEATIMVAAPMPQLANRSAKADRATLLLNLPSYANFDPSVPALALSPDSFNRFDGRANANGLLNDAQIAGIASRLRLTPPQAEHWPAVAAALRNVGRRYFQSRGRDHKVARKVDVNSPEVQQLIQAAVPLIQQLSNDQKREVRQLVRIIGLETVATQI
jgi:hypothetical protein